MSRSRLEVIATEIANILTTRGGKQKLSKSRVLKELHLLEKHLGGVSLCLGRLEVRIAGGKTRYFTSREVQALSPVLSLKLEHVAAIIRMSTREEYSEEELGAGTRARAIREDAGLGYIFGVTLEGPIRSIDTRHFSPCVLSAGHGDFVLCEGTALVPITQALIDGRLFDAFDMAWKTIQNTSERSVGRDNFYPEVLQEGINAHLKRN